MHFNKKGSVTVVVQIDNVTDILFKLSHPKAMPRAHAPIHLCCVRNYDIPPFPNEEGEEQLCKTKYAQQN